jgi:hypothetical protein
VSADRHGRGRERGAPAARSASGPKKGQCNANAAPVAQFQGALEGSGDVSF